MEKTIWKYELPMVDTTISMPIGAEILAVQLQKKIVCMWALIDPGSERENRNFRIVGTGSKKKIELKKENYLGTVQQEIFVWHIFEII